MFYNAFCLGSYGLLSFSNGFRLLSYGLRGFVSLFAVGSTWAPTGLLCFCRCVQWALCGWLLGQHGLLLGSCIFAGVCSGLPHGLLLGARVFAATCSGLPHGLLLGPCFFSNYLWWAPAWAPFGLLYFCRYLRWAPAWAPSGLLCFAGHGVLAAKNTIVGFEIRKFPVFLQLWS